MPETTLRAAVDTWANQDRPTTNYVKARSLALLSGGAHAFMFFNRPTPLGAVVSKATLRLYYHRPWAGTATLSIHRLSEQMRSSRLNWNNRPAVTGSAATASAPAGPEGQLVEVDVTDLMQAVADGAPWHGFRIITSATSTDRLVSVEGTSRYRPTLEVEWSEEPHAPTNLAPSGGQAASTAKPLLRFQVTDLLGDTTLSAVRVQLGPTPDFVGAWDSGWVPSSLPQLDLVDTAYPGITEAATVYWRAAVQDGAGLDSEWSDDASLTYVPHGTVIINNPAPGTSPYVADPTPRILWAFSGVQTRWQVEVSDAADPTVVLADSGERTTAETAWAVPADKPLAGPGPYRVVVRVWDDVTRAATDPYAELSRDFVMQDDPAVTPVAELAATQPEPWPGVLLTWTRGTAPDSFVIVRDGATLEADLLPEDALVSGTTYQYVDPGARVWHPHVWQVKAKVNEAQSDSPVVDLTPRTRGIWLLDETNNRRVWLAGEEGGSWTRPEDATTLTPIGGTYPVRRVQGLRKYEGSLAGQLVDGYGRTAAEYENDLYAMRKDSGQPVHLAVADMSLKVLLGNVQTAPTTHIPPSRIVAFDFWEVE